MTGPGTAKKLEKHGILTMGELARYSLNYQDILYKEFGADTELLIDHAWGYEPCGMKEIKAYRPSINSISEGQVLACPYPYDKARIIVKDLSRTLSHWMSAMTGRTATREPITARYTSTAMAAPFRKAHTEASDSIIRPTSADSSSRRPLLYSTRLPTRL